MSVPFLTHERAQGVVARRGGLPVTRARLAGDIAALAAILRPARYVMNLCTGRYRFVVALGAAMTRGQVTLLPPNDTPVMLAQLADAYEGVYILCDREVRDLPAPVLRIPDLLAGPPRDDVPVFPAAQEAVILFTSGSTGHPKPQTKTWGALVHSTKAAGVTLGVAQLAGGTVFGTVPLQHSYGLESTVMLALQHALAFDAARPFFPADVFSALSAAPSPRLLVTTPVHLRALVLDKSEKPRADFLLSATAPLAPALARDAEAAFGCPVHEIYGCSEAGQIAARRTVDGPLWTALDGFTLRQEGDTTYTSSPDILPEEIALQDVIELLDPTHFVLHGRMGDLVNIAGKRSSLGYLNAHLNAIEGVHDGVFVIPDAPDGDDGGAVRLMAFVVAPGLTAATIIGALRQRIDPAFLPRPLCFVEALPRNTLGKLPSDALRQLVENADVR